MVGKAPLLPEPTKGRLFIVANGPSLQRVDLDLLQGETAWGMNRIHLWYDRMSWRPDRWFWGDHPQRHWQLEEIFNYVRTFKDQEIWLRRDICEILTGDYRAFGDNWDFFEDLPGHVTSWDYCVDHNASWNTSRQPDEVHWLEPEHLCKPGSSLFAVWQSGVWEGYDPIIILGADAGFKPAAGGVQPLDHMEPGYYDDKVQTTQEQADAINGMLAWQHQFMQDWSEKNGREIFLATPGGEIEAHPRVKYEDLF